MVAPPLELPALDPSALDETATAIDGGVSAIRPSAARATIDRWHDACSQAGLDGAARDLGTLRDLLAADALDGRAIGQTLRGLADATANAEATDARWSPSLNRLAGALGRAARALGA